MRAVSEAEISDMAAKSRLKIRSAYTSIVGAHKARNLGPQLLEATPRDARRQMDLRVNGGALFGDGAGLFEEYFLVTRQDLVGLGEHELIGDGTLVEECEHFFIRLGDAMAAVDEDEDAVEAGPAAQIGLEQPLPLLDVGFGRLGIAIARHVD